MTVGSILLAVALFLLVGMYIFRPILTPAPPAYSPTEKDALTAQKEALLTHIRALDFDFETGKISSADYETERAKLLQTAADTLRQIDQLPVQSGRDINAEIEAAIAQLRQLTKNCPHCDQALPEDHQFCGKCGGEL